MEGYKLEKQLENHIQDILKFLEDYEPHEWKVVSLKNFQFQLIWLSEEAEDANTFFSRSTQIDGYDIYISPKLSKEQMKRQLFHEILEIFLNEQGLPDTDVHQLALNEEEKIFGERMKEGK